MSQKMNISAEDIEQFNEQLRQLLSSGYPLAEGLSKFSDEIERPEFKEAVQRISAGLSEGKSLSDSIEGEEASFSPEYIGLIRAGEESNELLGILDTALEHERFISRMEEGLRKALFYPVVVFGWTLIAFAVTMVYAFPILERLYNYAHMSLPGLFVLIRSLYGPWGLLVILWLVLLMVIVWSIKHKWGLGSMAMVIPGLRRLIADVYAARLSRTLGIMLKAGVRLDNALATIAGATSDPTIKRKLIRASSRTGEGIALSKVISEIGLSGTGLSELVELGEESGTLPEVLTTGSELYRVESVARLDVTLRILGLALLVAVGIWVLILLLSFMESYSLIPLLTL